MSSEPEALRLARKLVHGPWSSWIEHADDLRATAAELRRLHAANADCIAWYEAMKAEREVDRAAMREALEALQEGRDALYEQAQEFHRSMAGYKPARHEAMDEAVRRADAAIEKLKARTA